MDLSLLLHLNGFLVHHDAVEDPLTVYVNLAELLFLAMLIAAFAFAGGHRRDDARRAVAAAGLSAGLALAFAQVVSRLVDRPRPFVDHASSVHAFLAHAADSGFPSDHATAAFAIGTALLLRFRAWGVVTLLAASVLAVGRVALGVHYPTDVLAGAALGAATALLLYLPRARRPIDTLADRASSLFDGAGRAIAAGLRPSPRG